MIVEGKGLVPPKPAQVFIRRHEMIVLHAEAVKRDTHRNYEGRSDKWGKGLLQPVRVAGIGEIQRSLLPILVGLVGEYGVKRYISKSRPEWQIEIDTALRDQGDNGIDLMAFGLKIQVKTKSRLHGDNLVKCAQRYGWHCVVFCRWNMADCVYLLGWAWNAAVCELEPQESPVGSWLNYCVPDIALSPMTSLVSEIEAWKGAQKQCR